MKVNIYDLAYLVAKKTGIEFDGVSEKVALISGEAHYITVDMNGNYVVHNKGDVLDLFDVKTGKPIKYSYKEIDEMAVPVDEVELGTFVCTFDEQYDSLLAFIKMIGLNPDDYPRNPQ